MKQSQAFAAFRQSLITDLQHAVMNELVPSFNAQCENIRRRVEEDKETYHNEAKAINLKKSLTYDLVLYRDQILNTVQEDLKTKVLERLMKDGAEVREEEIPHPKKEGRMKRTIMATFPDKSTARVPSALWIDYSMFDRV